MEDAHHLVFRLGRRWYAAPVDRAFEVLELTSPTRVPGASFPIRGVIAHRGEVIPVVDLAAGSPDGLKAREASRALLIRSSGGPLAVGLSQVVGLAELKSPSTVLGEHGLESCLGGPALHQGLEVWVLDPERLYTFLCREEPADGRTQ